MTIDQLGLYNGALRMAGERRLSTLTEARETRYVLDDIWAEDVIKACLEAGGWAFATRTVLLTQDTEPDFGYQFGFQKPTDWVRTVAISLDEYFQPPLREYRDEADFLFLDNPEVYLAYVSDDAAYGRDYSLWPVSFINYVQSYICSKIVPTLTASMTTVEKLQTDMRKILADAQGKNALTRPTQMLPEGSWISARRGNQSWTRRSDR